MQITALAERDRYSFIQDDSKTGTSMTKDRKEKLWPLVRFAGRLGLISHGMIYGTVGLMAVHVFSGLGGESQDFVAVLMELSDSVLGKIYISCLGCGFFGFAVWRFVQAIFDTEEVGKSWQGRLFRAGFVFIGIGHAFLGFSIARMMLTGEGESAQENTENMVRRMLESWYGPWLVVLAASIVAGSAVYQFVQGYFAGFRETLKREQMAELTVRVFTWLGRVGLFARGILFGLLSFLLFWAVYTFDADKAGSHGEALTALASFPLGWWLVMAEAVGLIAYASFSAGQAKYRYMFMEEKN